MLGWIGLGLGGLWATDTSHESEMPGWYVALSLVCGFVGTGWFIVEGLMKSPAPEGIFTWCFVLFMLLPFVFWLSAMVGPPILIIYVIYKILTIAGCISGCEEGYNNSSSRYPAP